MKRRSLFLCLCGLLLLLSGCAYATVTAQQADSAYDLYFREADLKAAPGGDALRAEKIQLPRESQESARLLAEVLVTRLLEGPQDVTLKSPFPTGTALLSLELKGSRAIVDLSASYGTLSGVSLTLADYAIALTLTQLPEISVVSITVRGQDLAYRDSQNFKARDVLLATTEDVVATLPATLYFQDETGVLAPEEVTLELYEGDTQVSAIIKALENGPASKELLAVFPENFRVKSAWLEEDTCYVNLSSGVMQELPEETQLLPALRSLVASLGSLDTVSEVQFLVDGEFAKNYGGVPVAEPYIPYS